MRRAYRVHTWINDQLVSSLIRHINPDISFVDSMHKNMVSRTWQVSQVIFVAENSL